MIQDRLLKYFDQITEAPDAVPRLRRFILDLAMRGKLVPQDLNDACSSEENEEEFSGIGTLKSTAQSEVKRENLLFELPFSWMWRRLGSLATKITDGEHATPPRIKDPDVPLVTAKNVRDGLMDYRKTDWVSREVAQKAWDRCRPEVGDILLVCVGATTGRLCILREPKEMVLVRSVALIRPEHNISVDFLAIALRSSVCQTQIWNRVKATAQPCLYINRIKSLYVPLPPIKEQLRIVAKVNELMDLCEKLGTAHAKRERRRDRLVASTFARLTTESAEPAESESSRPSMSSAVPFFLKHIPRLTIRPVHIKQLHQTVLNLAIHGKLVPQDPTDEPAAQLLQRIEAERQRLTLQGSIKRVKVVLYSSEGNTPFDLPPTWCWERFGNIAAIQSNLVNPHDYPNHPHIAPDNIESRTGRLLPYVTVAEAKVSSAKHLFFPRSIIYSKIRPNLAKATVVDFEGLCSADAYPIYSFLDLQYLLRFMLSDAFIGQSMKEDNRVAMPKINQDALNRIMVAVPPSAEQRRIVAKVDELISICDELEGQITRTNTMRYQLLEAVLQEALMNN